jgi:hypothetical protein
MSLLGEVQGVQAWEEHRIHVDLEQIVEVLSIARGEGVRGPVAAGEGVHEGVQRAPGHQEEGVAHREALAATERGVLQDVCNARRVLRHGQEGNQEGIVVVLGGEVQVAGAGGAVTVFLHCQVQ